MDEIIDRFTIMVSELSSVNIQYTSLQLKYKDLQSEFDDVSSICTTLISRNSELEKKIYSLSQDNEEFKKVSHVVALEKENSKLRELIELYDRSNKIKSKNLDLEAANKDNILESKNCSSEHEPNSSESSTKDIRESTPIIENIQSSSSEIKEPKIIEQFSIRKIKGKSYFISIDNEVYEIDETDKPGNLVGNLEKRDGKTRIKWINKLP